LARQIGWTQDEVEALADTQASPLFDPPLKAALLYAERMTRDAHTVTDEQFADLRRHYTEPQILELTCVIGLCNYWNRFTAALRVDLSGTDEPYDPPR
jgi:alkylhydroperoxidase family enzyme